MSNNTLNDNSSTVLLILAGYRAVSEITLCKHALGNGIPLFGKNWKRRFLILGIPSHLPG